MKKLILLMLGLLLTIGNAIAAGQKQNYKPTNGFVPDEKTAIQIAIAIWIPIYGEKNISHESPYHATLQNGIWIVEGSLVEGVTGGVAIAEINKDDGRIIRVSHGK